MTASSGLVIVDKPAGWTSHDVVARIRRLAGTRRVGHAGTLDPAATGVLVVGVERATRVLGHLGRTDKAYDATIRLGERTTTDDAEGDQVSASSAGGVTEEDVRGAAAALTGRILQTPPQVSAVKIAGKRSYTRVRAGEQVSPKPRPVTVYEFTVRELRAGGEAGEAGVVLDVEASVVCSSGTYVRALARDLGDSLGVGGHLTRLRRTRVGPYSLRDARTMEDLTRSFRVLPLADAVAAVFPRRDVPAAEAWRVAHGGRLPAAGLGPGPVGVFGPDGELLALVEESEGIARPLAVLAE